MSGRRTPAAVLAGVILAGALIRFSTLGEQSYWEDEGYTYAVIAHGFGHVLTAVATHESNPPLYYVLAWLWSRVFGLSEVGLRSFSALCGTLTIPVMWALGRRLVSDRTALILAALTAVNPLLFWYSQEARAYALLLLLSASSLLALVWALERPTPRRLTAWVLVSALALTTHYCALFAVLPEAIWLLAVLRERGRLDLRTLAVLSPLVAVGIALAPLAAEQSHRGLAHFVTNEEGSLPFRLTSLAKQDVVSYGNLPGAVTLGGFALVAVALGLLTRTSRAERARLALPAAVALIGVGAPAVLALVASDYINTRNLMETWPAFALLVGGGLGAARAGRAGAATFGAMVALSLSCVAAVVLDTHLQRADWRAVAEVMGRASPQRAIVSAFPDGPSLEPYLSRISDYPVGGAWVAEVDVVDVSGHWGGTSHTLGATVPLAGFAVVARRVTPAYRIVRYRALHAQPETAAQLARLYPNLPDARVLLQAPAHQLQARAHR